MVLHRNRQTGVVHIARKLLNDVGDKGLFALVGQRQKLRGDRCRAHKTRYESRWNGIAQCPVLEPNTDVVQSGVPGEAPQFLCGVERERRIKGCLRLCAEEGANAGDRRKMKRLPLQCAPRVERETPFLWAKRV
jgi:hypothetical protein